MMPEPLHLPELVERLRNVNYNTSKSELLRLCHATAEVLTPTSDDVAGAERFIQQTFADQALLDSDTSTGEIIAETPLDDVLPALALTFSTWRAAAIGPPLVHEPDPVSYPVGGDALRDILLRGGSPLAIEVPSSGLHQKIIHNGTELCDTCVNIFGIRMRWEGAVASPQHQAMNHTDADATERAARALNLSGWTCSEGVHEPGEFDTCSDCREICPSLARRAIGAAFKIPKEVGASEGHADWCHFGQCAEPSHCTCDQASR